MITQYPERRRYDQSAYERFFARRRGARPALSLHTATRQQGRIRTLGEKTLRDASVVVARFGT
jgi:hypothetical protein